MLALHSRRTLPEHVRFYVKSRETVIYSVFRDFCTKKERETMKIIKRNGSEATLRKEPDFLRNRFTILQTTSNINATRSDALYP